MSMPQPPQYPNSPQQQWPAPKSDWFSRHKTLTIVMVAVFAIVVIFGAFGSASEDTADSGGQETLARTDSNQPSKKVGPPKSEPESVESVSQANARETAADYLDYSGFSRKGLIGQLKFEGYSKADATYGVDSLDADWNQQAARTAQDYLDYDAFSRAGLINQLVFEGFTHSQAAYGVTQTGL